MLGAQARLLVPLKAKRDVSDQIIRQLHAGSSAGRGIDRGGRDRGYAAGV